MLPKRTIFNATCMALFISFIWGMCLMTSCLRRSANTIGFPEFPPSIKCLENSRPAPGHQLECLSEFGLPFLLYLPPRHRVDGDSLPVIVFLHGAGERGSYLLSDADMLIQGPPKLASEHSSLLQSFAVVSPQCGMSDEWESRSMQHNLMEVLRLLSATCNLDPARRYLTGVSFGGFGTWSLGGILHDRFAAIVPVSGGGSPRASWVPHLRCMPIWAFHGANDIVVDVRYTDAMVTAVRKLGNRNVRYTRYNNSPAYEKYPEMIGHNAAEAAYQTKELYTWLLTHTLNGTPPV